MRTQARFIRLAAFAAVLAAGTVQAQQPQADGISDLGAFEQVPYQLEPQLNLRAQDRMTLRNLEDKHIADLRSFEDRYERDLRALRAKQQAEREGVIRTFRKP